MNSNGRLARRYEHNSNRDAVLLARRGRGSAGCHRVAVRLEPRPHAVPEARTALEPIEPHVEPRTLGDVRLLVSELVTNSVRHSGRGADGEIGLEVTLEPDSLRVEVADPGAGFEPRPRARNQSQGSGWGLFLVDRLTDRWGVAADGGTRVWFEIDRRGREVAA